MPYYRALISALTLFGGHFLNRRLDRVVHVSGMLALTLTAYVVLPNLLAHLGRVGADDALWLLRLISIMVGFIALASACLTWKDARAAAGLPLSLTTRLAGGMMSLCGLFVVGIFALITVLSPKSAADKPPIAAGNARETSSETSSFTVARNFYSTVHYGGTMKSYELPAPPQGNNPLRGRITLDGAPASGVKLDVYINQQYKSVQASDMRGEFQIDLPAGEWYVNVVVAHDWAEAPKGRDLVLFSAHEPRHRDSQYSRFDWSNQRGLRAQLPAAPDAVSVALELRDAMKIEWPQAAPMFFSSEQRPAIPQADLESSIVRWQPVAGASQYQVQIDRVTREENSTHYRPVLVRNVSEPRLVLAALPRQEESSAAVGEYSVEVFAFDTAGNLLAQSEVNMGDHVFQLAGKMRLAEDPSSCDSPPAVPSAEKSRSVADAASATAHEGARSPRCS